MGEEPNFLSKYSVAFSEIGLGFRLETMIEPSKTGPALQFWVHPKQATEFAESILEAVRDWNKRYQQ